MPSDSSGVRAQGSVRAATPRRRDHRRQPPGASRAARRDLLSPRVTTSRPCVGAGGRPASCSTPRAGPAADEFDGVDGLLLTGDDVDPSCYGEHPSHDSAASTPERDVAQIELQPGRRACAAGTSHLRGCQVLQRRTRRDARPAPAPKVTTQAPPLAEQRGVRSRGGDRRTTPCCGAPPGVRRSEVNRIHHQAVGGRLPDYARSRGPAHRTIEALELSGPPGCSASVAPREPARRPPPAALWLVAGPLQSLTYHTVTTDT